MSEKSILLQLPWVHIYSFLDETSKKKMLYVNTVFWGICTEEAVKRLKAQYPREYHTAVRAQREDYTKVLHEAEETRYSLLSSQEKYLFKKMLAIEPLQLKQYFKSFEDFFSLNRWRFGSQELRSIINTLLANEDRMRKTVLTYWREAGVKQALLDLVFEYKSKYTPGCQVSRFLHAIECLQPTATLQAIWANITEPAVYDGLLESAIQHDHLPAIEIIAPHVTLHPWPGKQPLLNIAAQHNAKKATQWLIEQKVAVNEVGTEVTLFSTLLTVQDPTPLLLAAWYGHVEMVTLLLANGADPQHTYKIAYPAAYSCSLLFLLMDRPQFTDQELISTLLKYGADVNKVATGFLDGKTALQAAAESQAPEMVELLIAQILKLRKKGISGITDHSIEVARKLVKPALYPVRVFSSSSKELAAELPPVVGWRWQDKLQQVLPFFGDKPENALPRKNKLCSKG